MTNRNHSSVKKDGITGVKKLNKEAFRLVEQSAKKIAKLLLDGTMKGHAMSTQLLIQLANADVDENDPATVRPLRAWSLGLLEELKSTDEQLDEQEQREAEGLEAVKA